MEPTKAAPVPRARPSRPQARYDGPSRYLQGIQVGSRVPEEPWAGADDPAVAEALAGKAILLAHRAADETLAEAARRAAAVMSDAEAKAAAIVDRARAAASALIADAQDTIAAVFGARTDDILGILDQSHRVILATLRSAESELSAVVAAAVPASAADVPPGPRPVSQSRLDAIRESSRRAAAKAASEGRAAQALALQRVHRAT